MSKPVYYNFADDKSAFPEAWLYVIYSGRGPGKTYSTLWDCISNDIKFGYIKRTMDDLNLIMKPEFSPFKAINRDKGTDIQIENIGGGLAKIVDASVEEKPVKGYALAMSAVHKFKGFELSEVEEMIFDEFIPQKSERVNRKEGELLLDLYMTVLRDKLARGLGELKLILLANTTNIACPVLLTLGLVDVIAEMQMTGEDTVYNADKGYFIRHIKQSPSVRDNMGIMRIMEGTAWAAATSGGDFAYNDFSAVRKMSIKGMFPVCGVQYAQDRYYIWRHKNTGVYYCCDVSTNNRIPWYNLDSEIEAKAFYQQYAIDFRQKVIDGAMYFSRYSAYDIIANYTKKFEV